MMTPRLSRRRLVPWSFAVAAVIGSCNLHNPGVAPPSAVLSFPSALALSREAAPRFLYVANSNFDLRYNAGSLQSYNLDALDRVLASNRCRAYGKLTPGDGGTRSYADETNYTLLGLLDAGQVDAGAGDAGADGGGLVLADAGSIDAGHSLDGQPIVLPDDYDLTSKYSNTYGFLCDGRDPPGYDGCCLDTASELDAVRQSAIEIDSFAVGVGVSPQNDRVYVPVSSRNQLLYFDVVNDQLSCGSETSRCRRGPGIKSPDHDPDDNFPGSLSAMTVGTLRDLVPPSELSAAQGLDLGATYVATSHDLGGFGLFVEESAAPGAPSAPILEDVLRNIGQRPRSVLADPARNVLYVASAGDSFISRISVRVNPASIPGEAGPRALLYETSRIVVHGVSQAGDLRDMAFDPNDHNRLYVLIRGTQESVGFLDIDPRLPASNARLVDSIRIGAGPSKLSVMVQDGRTFVLVTCYDSKSIYIIDAKEHVLAAVVRSLSGPFTMAYDPSRKLLHVADFRSSVLRVVDLHGLTDRSEPPPRIVATIGSPQFEGALQ